MPGVSVSAQLPKLRQEDRATDAAMLHFVKNVDVVPGSSTQRYRSLKWPTAPSSSPTAAAGPLGEGAVAEESDTDHLGSCLLVSAAKAEEISAPLIKTTASLEIMSNALDDMQGTDPTPPAGKIHKELAIIASLISEYERMVRETKVALKQLKTWTALCLGAIKLHVEVDPRERERNDLLFAMIMASNYVELSKAGVGVSS